MENLRLRIEELNKEYETLMDDISSEKAQGNLSTLYNLKTQFDETFDTFFDNSDLRKKYDDWDYEEDCIKLEKTGDDLLKEFDNTDLNSYIEFFENYIEDLKEELKELKAD